jgi:hypothetical protein
MPLFGNKKHLTNKKRHKKNNHSIRWSNVACFATSTPSEPSGDGGEGGEEEKKNLQSSFFAQFDSKEILNLWKSSNTLLEVATQLGFNNPKGLARVDYEYIQ